MRGRAEHWHVGQVWCPPPPRLVTPWPPVGGGSSAAAARNLVDVGNWLKVSQFYELVVVVCLIMLLLAVGCCFVRQCLAPGVAYPDTCAGPSQNLICLAAIAAMTVAACMCAARMPLPAGWQCAGQCVHGHPDALCTGAARCVGHLMHPLASACLCEEGAPHG